MDLSFQEKSAWGLLAGIVIVSAFYFPAALRIVDHAGRPLALIALSVVGLVALVVIEVVYHAVIAVAGNDASDERDALIELKAERNGGLMLGIVLFVVVGHIVAQHALLDGTGPSPLLIAVYIIAALTFSEVAKLLSQIWHYRVGS